MPLASARQVAVIGGGPAGLMAAEVLASSGLGVTVYDTMPSVGRKFLLAGRGGLNLTHSEPSAAFLSRYGARAADLAPMLEAFGPDALRQWASALGIDTFIGSSGRIFPREMKAAPLLRAWLARLRTHGVRFAVRHRWLGWATQTAAPSHTLRFATREGEHQAEADAVILALGGGSWSRLGSDGTWVEVLRTSGIGVSGLRPANCGFDIATKRFPNGWSGHFLERFGGAPVKSVQARCTGPDGTEYRRSGECMISPCGIEGGLIYALSAPLRDMIEMHGQATLYLDLAPGRSLERLTADLSRPRGSRSFASHLQGQTGLKGVKAAILRECVDAETMNDPIRLAAAIKALPLVLVAPRPLDEAISSAGGVRFEDTVDGSMLRALPGVFCAGEMLDWEAPTGGYLLTACFASGHAAARHAIAWLDAR